MSTNTNTTDNTGLTLSREDLYQRTKHGSHNHRYSHSMALSDVFPPVEVFVSESGVQGEVMRLPSASNENSLVNSPSQCDQHTHVVFLPGNPGVIEYYRPFIQNLWQRLTLQQQKCYHFHALGLPGHDLRHLNNEKRFIISDHRSYCLSYLRSKMFSPPLSRSKLIFVGHSYGSFLALDIIKELSNDETVNIYLAMLMPCVWEMGRCAGLWTRIILRDIFQISTWIASLLTAMVPPFIRDIFISMVEHDQDTATISRKMVDGRRQALYSNITSLGRDEMLHIHSPHSMPGIKRLSTSSLLVCAVKDRWCPPSAQKEILSAFGEVQVEVKQADVGLTHAFVLNRRETDVVVDMVLEWFKQVEKSRI